MKTVQIDQATSAVCAIVSGEISTPPPIGRAFVVIADDVDVKDYYVDGKFQDDPP